MKGFRWCVAVLSVFAVVAGCSDKKHHPVPQVVMPLASVGTAGDSFPDPTIRVTIGKENTSSFDVDIYTNDFNIPGTGLGDFMTIHFPDTNPTAAASRLSPAANVTTPEGGKFTKYTVQVRKDGEQLTILYGGHGFWATLSYSHFWVFSDTTPANGMFDSGEREALALIVYPKTGVVTKGRMR